MKTLRTIRDLRRLDSTPFRAGTKVRVKNTRRDQVFVLHKAPKRSAIVRPSDWAETSSVEIRRSL